MAVLLSSCGAPEPPPPTAAAEEVSEESESVDTLATPAGKEEACEGVGKVAADLVRLKAKGQTQQEAVRAVFATTGDPAAAMVSDDVYKAAAGTSDEEIVRGIVQNCRDRLEEAEKARQQLAEQAKVWQKQALEQLTLGVQALEEQQKVIEQRIAAQGRQPQLLEAQKQIEEEIVKYRGQLAELRASDGQ